GELDREDEPKEEGGVLRPLARTHALDEGEQHAAGPPLVPGPGVRGRRLAPLYRIPTPGANGTAMTGRAGRVRLDQLLVQRGLAPTRERAQALLLAGSVLVDGARASKPGTQVNPEATVELQAELPFVS